MNEIWECGLPQFTVYGSIGTNATARKAILENRWNEFLAEMLPVLDTIV